MSDDTMDLAAERTVEALLRDELARENRAAAAVIPVLRHMLANEARSLVSDAVAARVRGMIQHCAAQLLAAVSGQDPALAASASPDPAELDEWSQALAADEGLLAFCHTLASEGLLAERLQDSGIDPVLSPLMQELIASPDPDIAALAMNALAAQSRFMQSQRRMQLPLHELDPALFHAAIAFARRAGGESDVFARVQQSYDEAASRLGLLARIVLAMRRGAVAALSLDHAGLALFATALAAQTRQTRDAAVLACREGQGGRLALMLRAADTPLPAIERQLWLIDPASPVLSAIASISPEASRTVLAATGTR